jgi:hypothetical protein
MIRTQIYLTEAERAALSDLSAATGKAQSEIIRGAIDRMIAETGKSRRSSILDRTAGLWKDRRDLPDFTALRDQWDRGNDQ